MVKTMGFLARKLVIKIVILNVSEGSYVLKILR